MISARSNFYLSSLYSILYYACYFVWLSFITFHLSLLWPPF